MVGTGGERGGRDTGATPHASTFDILFAYVEETVIVLDHQARIAQISPAVRPMLGYDPASVIGRSMFDFLHPDELDALMDDIARWEDRSGRPRGQVQRVLAADGRWVPLHYDAVMGRAAEPVGSMVLTLRPADPGGDHGEVMHRLMNEDRLVRLASAFLHVSVDRFEDGLREAVEELAGLSWVTRVSVWTADGDEWIDRRAVWSSATEHPVAELPERIRQDVTNIARRLVAGEEVHISSVHDLPDDWELERLVFEEWGVESLLAMPMMDAGRFTGAVMIEVTRDRVTLDATHSSTVRSAAAILTGAFARHDAELELARRARTDQLTGLPNRWAFEDELGHALARLGAGGSAGVGVALVDLDRFKVINDAAGHFVGDRVIGEIADRLLGQVAAGSTVARSGGDEWLVLFPDLEDLKATVAATEHLLDCLRAPFDVAGRAVVISASAGVVFRGAADAAAPDVIEILRRADAARHRAKDLGGGHVEADGEAGRLRVTDRLTQESELRTAIEDGEVVAHYQAEWDLRDGRLLGAEALARWQHATLGLLTADSFIALSEECGLVHALGTHVLREACAAAAGWNDLGLLGADFGLRVNVSARQLLRGDLSDLVADTLTSTGLPAAMLCLELTESSLLADPDRAVAMLRGLRDLGVGLALDDFGTGYSSMVYLKRLPLSSLKIDRSFVAGLPSDRHDAAIVTASVQLAGALGITVTAEGVETQFQRDALLDLGCRRAQGFLIARPESASDFESRLRIPSPPDA